MGKASTFTYSTFVSAALTFGLLIPGSAMGGWTRQSAATSCVPMNYSVSAGNDSADSQAASQASGFLNNQSTGGMNVVCSITDAGFYAKQNINLVNVHVVDNSDSAGFFAKLCITFFDSTSTSAGGSCGSSSSTTGAFTGGATLQPSLSKFTAANALHFGQLQVTIPAGSGIAGYYTQSP